jgi:hypothetical protein
MQNKTNKTPSGLCNKNQRANGFWKTGRVLSLGVNISGSAVTLSRVWHFEHPPFLKLFKPNSRKYIDIYLSHNRVK